MGFCQFRFRTYVVLYIAAPYATECVDVGNSLLGFKVQKEALGL